MGQSLLTHAVSGLLAAQRQNDTLDALIEHQLNFEHSLFRVRLEEFFEFGPGDFAYQNGPALRVGAVEEKAKELKDFWLAFCIAKSNRAASYVDRRAAWEGIGFFAS